MAGASSGTVASSSWCRLNVHLHRALSRKSGPHRECNPWTRRESGAGNAWLDTTPDRPRINPQGGAGFFAVRIRDPRAFAPGRPSALKADFYSLAYSRATSSSSSKRHMARRSPSSRGAESAAESAAIAR